MKKTYTLINYQDIDIITKIVLLIILITTVMASSSNSNCPPPRDEFHSNTSINLATSYGKTRHTYYISDMHDRYASWNARIYVYQGNERMQAIIAYVGEDADNETGNHVDFVDFVENELPGMAFMITSDILDIDESYLDIESLSEIVWYSNTIINGTNLRDDSITGGRVVSYNTDCECYADYKRLETKKCGNPNRPIVKWQGAILVNEASEKRYGKAYKHHRCVAHRPAPVVIALPTTMPISNCFNNVYSGCFGTSSNKKCKTGR